MNLSFTSFTEVTVNLFSALYGFNLIITLIQPNEVQINQHQEP